MPNAPLVSWRGERAKIPLPLRIIGRYFVTGQSLRGPGDNATFLHRATVDYRARPYLTLSGPVWQRLARRNGAITVPLLLAVLIPTPWINREAVAAYLALLLLAALSWMVWSVRLELQGRRRNREWIDPAAKVLCSLLKIRYVRRSGRDMISLPRAWGAGRDREDEARPAVRVAIPAGTPLSTSLKKAITENVGARLGIPKPVNADWREAGESVFVELSAAPLPPKEVTWASLASAIEACPDDRVILGRESGGHLVDASLSEDSPHFLLSGASGTGKSVLIRVFLIQRIRRGDGVIITDPKKFSHWRWAGGGKLSRDRVIYAYRDEDLHETWLAVAAETKRRIELDEEELEGQRRVFVVAEELNAQIKRLIRYWRGLRKEISTAAKLAQAADEPYDPADLDPPIQSPAVVALQETVFMGRELKIHMVVAAQRASANVFGGGGGDVRESFQGGRLVAKWDRKLWKMLVDTLDYVACPNGTRGIWGLAKGSEFHIFRVPWLSEVDALELAKGGQATTGPVLGQQTGQRTVDSTSVDNPAIVQGVKLSDAVGQCPSLGSLDSLRRASTREGFPLAIGQQGSAKLYSLADLVEWRDRV